MGVTQTLLVVTGSAIAVLTFQTYLSEYSIGFASGQHITVNQRNVRGTVKAGRGGCAGIAIGCTDKSDQITVNQEDVQADVEADPEGCAGVAIGSLGNCGTSGNSHGNDYSGGDGDDNGNDGGH